MVENAENNYVPLYQFLQICLKTFVFELAEHLFVSCFSSGSILGRCCFISYIEGVVNLPARHVLSDMYANGTKFITIVNPKRGKDVISQHMHLWICEL